MDIRQDDLNSPQVVQLLQLHLDSMAPTAPPESRHALDLTGLRDPAVTFWCVWDGQQLAGFGALKQLSPRAGEIKSMRTAPAYLRRGIAQTLLAHIEQEACERGYEALFLETGAMDFFAAARQLYLQHGYEPCPPFARYREDPNSIFMRKNLLGCA
ncbi:MAG TPA: GNAT family N-acetyltransferase [Hyphomicrobiales bacterium]|nr:GNAT family N-acetyltransferase [Hyphomicrobiales bacterium]